jgi:hypothetical protein
MLSKERTCKANQLTNAMSERCGFNGEAKNRIDLNIAVGRKRKGEESPKFGGILSTVTVGRPTALSTPFKFSCFPYSIDLAPPTIESSGLPRLGSRLHFSENLTLTPAYSQMALTDQPDARL